MAFLTQGGLTALYYVTNASSQLRRITLPAAPPKPPVVPPVPPPPAPQIGVTNLVSPAAISAPGRLVQHVVTITNTGTSTVAVVALRDTVYGDLTRLGASTCAAGGSIAPAAAYTCTFSANVLGSSGSVADVLTATAANTSGGVTTATSTATVEITEIHCTIANVRGQLASTARSTITAKHCRASQIVVVMHHGVPRRAHHKLVRAVSAARPTARPGRGKIWTLRVENVVQKPGATLTAGATETIFVGWEATPSAIAHKHGARFL